MIKNINKSTIVLASNCRDNPSVFNQVKKLINMKFPKEENLKISIINTARMGYRNKSRSQLLKDTKIMTKKYEYKRRLGNHVLEYIDCSRKRNYAKFEKSIKNNKIIWVTGGDTLYLMYHLKKSGFDKLLKKRILKDNIIFVGCCAGAILAGKSIMPTFIDRATKRKKKYYLKHTYKKKFWNKKNNKNSLNLVDNMHIIPHCNNNLNSKNNIISLRNKRMFCLPEKKQLIFNV